MREEIRVVLPEDDAAVSQLLAASFVDSSVYGYIFTHPDRRKRQSDLAWFFHARLGINRDMGSTIFGTFLIDDAKQTSQCVATLTLGPIQSQSPSFCVKFRHGLLLWPLKFGYPSLQRAISIGDTMTERSLLVVKDQTDLGAHKAWEMMMVATDPAHQGRGYATRLIQHALNEIRVPGDSVGLSTQNQRTVQLYQRVAGFEVTSDQWFTFANPDTKFQSWSMKLRF
jgi:hypothetical protein